MLYRARTETPTTNTLTIARPKRASCIVSYLFCWESRAFLRPRIRIPGTVIHAEGFRFLLRPTSIIALSTEDGIGRIHLHIL